MKCSVFSIVFHCVVLFSWWLFLSCLHCYYNIQQKKCQEFLLYNLHKNTLNILYSFSLDILLILLYNYVICYDLCCYQQSNNKSSKIIKYTQFRRVALAHPPSKKHSIYTTFLLWGRGYNSGKKFWKFLYRLVLDKNLSKLIFGF